MRVQFIEDRVIPALGGLCTIGDEREVDDTLGSQLVSQGFAIQTKPARAEKRVNMVQGGDARQMTEE